MTEPAHSCLVTVYLFRGVTYTPDGLRIDCHRLRQLAVSTSDHRERMAAEAWVKCEGLHRRQKLIELKAPEAIIKYETDVEAIAAEMTPAPSGFGDDESYLYDNSVETWLMVIATD